MKFSDIQDMLYDYENAMYSPSRSDVHVGCDCGCGGNSYTIESYDAEEETAERAIKAIKEFCETHGFEYNGV